MRIARVEPLTTARALRGPFDYLLAEGFPAVGIGTRLAVPFAGRTITAVVVELASRSELPTERLAAPLRIVEPSIPEELVPLALRVARSCCSTPARALALVAPPGRAAGGGPRTLLHATRTQDGARALDEGGRLTVGQRQVLERLAAGPATAAQLGCGNDALRRLERRGLVRMEPVRVRRRPEHGDYDPGRIAPDPTAEQAAALAAITAAIDSGEPDAFLLHGVTGSGKTEVYLGAAERSLALARGVIVLVPEIGLTPQAAARFRARLGDTVAVIHSGLSEGERFDEWTRLADGEAMVCVGPRSAVFAPVRDLGLVVVDEEHESAYRNDGDPGYDAREVASWRAEMAGAVLVAGSATPRPESVRRMARLRIDRRPDGSGLPPVELLDMRGLDGPLHPRSLEALALVARNRRKAIVLLNRRGWSNFVACASCGRTWSCPQCDVTLVLHMGEGRIACHHCGHSEQLPSSCPDCGSASISRHGAGTEQVEDAIRRAVGDRDFPVMRLDSDAAARKGAAAETLRAFQSAPAGVLVGTQMVAKGHDFPDVELGLVIDADSTLRFPDFRAEERTFQLVTQLAGRAGRGGAGGRVLVQTVSPEARSLVLAASHDSDTFVAEELERRDALGYPPALALVRVQVAAIDAADAEAAATAIASAVEASGIEVLGPAELFRLRGRERRQLVARGVERELVVEAVDSAVAAVAATAEGRRCSIGTEVDAG